MYWGLVTVTDRTGIRHSLQVVCEFVPDFKIAGGQPTGPEPEKPNCLRICCKNQVMAGMGWVHIGFNLPHSPPNFIVDK